MSKLGTINALKQSAMLNFSKYGLEAASLRDIARDAGVPLSAVHIYFGSKSDLYAEVSRIAWEDLERERDDLIDTATKRNKHGIASLRDIIYALAYPVARRGLSDKETDLAWVWILRGGVWQHGYPSSPHMIGGSEKAIARWINEVEIRCSELSHVDVVWAYSFVLGTIYSWQLIDRLYDRFIEGEEHGTVDRITNDIVSFCCSGIDAMIAHRRCAALPSLNHSGRVSSGAL